MQDYNDAKTKRNRIRESLKGTLKAWKVDPEKKRRSNQIICDRTPYPGVTGYFFQDRFDLVKKIGEGSSGIVFLCRYKKNDKEYAVKIMRGGEQRLMLSKKEFKILGEIKHPYIIRSKCIFLNEESEKIYKVMEYFPYPSLEQVYREINDEEKKMIITMILEALQFLHKRGICHRDIKLQNILYNQQDKDLRLIDFGISKKSGKTQDGFEKMWTITGTLQYMAPQMFQGSSYDLTVDCWAVGILAYKLFYKKFPFQSQFKSTLIQLIQEKEPEYPQADILLNNFLKYLLKKNSQDRLTAFNALRHPWIERELKLKERMSFQQDFDMNLKDRRSGYILNDSEHIGSKEEVIQKLKEQKIFEHKKKIMKVEERKNESF